MISFPAAPFFLDSIYPFYGSIPLIVLLLHLKLPVLCYAGTAQFHVDSGKKLLSSGQLADALSQFHSAVEADPRDTMSYYWRATTFLALGRSKAALPDLSRVIDMKPDFTSARLQRGNLYLKQGKLDDAEADFRAILPSDSSHQEATRQLSLLPELRDDIDDAEDFVENSEYDKAVPLLSKAIELCPWDTKLRTLRADCYIAQGEYYKAVNDLRPTAKLIPDNTAAYYKISQLLYQVGDAEESLREIRECLKLDADHKQCFQHYKKVKKIAKQLESAQEYKTSEQWDDCIDKARAILKTENFVQSFVLNAKSYLCHCYAKSGQLGGAMEACGEVLSMDENNIDALCDRAEAHISAEEYEKAIEDYQTAAKIDEENGRVRKGLETAQKLLKQSKKRDYYKILGVKRTAHKREILKAFRKLAMKWHPDKFENEADRKNAEKKFVDLAAAKEVLTNPEKRAKFDAGEDPLDAEEQAGGGGFHGHPFFQRGFNPFGNDGFSFKFHFG